MEALQTLAGFACVFLIVGGLFNKAWRFQLYGLGIVMMLIFYLIHQHRMAHDPAYRNLVEEADKKKR